MNNSEIQAFLIETTITKPMQAYSDCLKQLIQNPKDGEAKARITEIEGFFLSEPFSALTHANGTEIVESIHAMLEPQGVSMSAMLDGKEQKDV
ncbi:MAG: hypothetical protein ACI4KA_09410 [Oscillospiraceae bacterium]